MSAESDQARFWAKVNKTETCWLWTAFAHKGYGRFGMRPRGTSLRAHRVSYEWANGPVPEGLVLDHLCRVTLCVRPDHLEAVTQGENVRRGDRGAVLLPVDTQAIVRKLNWLGHLTVSQKADAVGLRRTTLYRRLNAGAFSAEELGLVAAAIDVDPADLLALERAA